MSKIITSIPAAKRTVNALKDMGYDLNSAVADIIDNSISRGEADNIYIKFIKDESNKKFQLYILDDGNGMTSETLEQAMKLGSSIEDYKTGDLSKYGMGMKTASMSQARKLTVISKTMNNKMSAYSWDLDHINKTDKWEIFKYSTVEINSILTKANFETDPILNRSLKKKSWTLIIWNNLTDFQTNYDSYKITTAANNYYYKTIDNIEVYLRLVFNRFLFGINNAKKTNIYVNEKKLIGLDPFCKSEIHTLQVKIGEKNSKFLIEDGYPPIIINAFALPTIPTKPGEFKFSSPDLWNDAKGTLSMNEAQGYYVFRNNRLINWGGWYGTKALDEHHKLARASIDLTEEHDDLFTLNVNKTKIQFPPFLKNHLKLNINNTLIKIAKLRYDGSERKYIDKINNSVRNKNKKISYLSQALVKLDNISVNKLEEVGLVIKNVNGDIGTTDLTYLSLEHGQKIISKSFGNSKFLWQMIPNPNNEFQVLVNTDHPFYNKIYVEQENNQNATAIMDAFLFTMAFIELKCLSHNNELLFDQMKEVASNVLAKFVEEKII